MLAVLYSLLFLSGGLFIAKFQFSDKNRVERLWLGLSVGILLEMCLPAIFAFFFRFSLTAHFLAASLDTVLGRVPPAPGAPGGTGWNRVGSSEGRARGALGAAQGLPGAGHTGLETAGWGCGCPGRWGCVPGRAQVLGIPVPCRLPPGSAPLTTAPLGSQDPRPHPRSSRILTRGVV